MVGLFFLQVTHIITLTSIKTLLPTTRTILEMVKKLHQISARSSKLSLSIFFIVANPSDHERSYESTNIVNWLNCKYCNSVHLTLFFQSHTNTLLWMTAGDFLRLQIPPVKQQPQEVESCSQTSWSLRIIKVVQYQTALFRWGLRITASLRRRHIFPEASWFFSCIMMNLPAAPQPLKMAISIFCAFQKISFQINWQCSQETEVISA